MRSLQLQCISLIRFWNKSPNEKWKNETKKNQNRLQCTLSLTGSCVHTLLTHVYDHGIPLYSSEGMIIAHHALQSMPRPISVASRPHWWMRTHTFHKIILLHSMNAPKWCSSFLLLLLSEFIIIRSSSRIVSDECWWNTSCHNDVSDPCCRYQGGMHRSEWLTDVVCVS